MKTTSKSLAVLLLLMLATAVNAQDLDPVEVVTSTTFTSGSTDIGQLTIRDGGTMLVSGSETVVTIPRLRAVNTAPTMLTIEAGGRLTVSDSASFTYVSNGVAGDNGTIKGTLEVLSGGTVKINQLYYMYSGDGSIKVSGENSYLEVFGSGHFNYSNQWTNNSILIEDGGYMKVSNPFYLSWGSYASSTLNVTTGGTFELTDAAGLRVAMNNLNSRGIVNVTDGGVIISKGASISHAEGSGTFFPTGIATVDGSTSVWDARDATNNIVVSNGALSKGTLILSNGGEMLGKDLILGNNATTPVALLLFGNAVGNADAGKLTLTGGITSNVTGLGAAIIRFNQKNEFTFDSNITGGLIDIEQTGSGTTTLTGNNNHTGATIVSAGKLVVGALGSIDNSTVYVEGGQFIVNGLVGNGGVIVTEGLLGGSGTVNGLTTVYSGATLTPDGTLTFDSGLTISNNATLAFGFDDTIKVTDGILHLGESVILNIAGAGSYTLFDYRGADLDGAGNLDTWDLGAFVMPDYKCTFNDDGSFITLTVEPIPEPGTWAMIFTGLSTLAGIQRLRRRQEDFSISDF